MRFVITILGFKNNLNSFIVKECALFTLDDRGFYHWLIKSPYAFSKLDNSRRREASYLTHKFHGLHWEQGDVDYEDWVKSLKTIADRAEGIYAKGKEISLFLSNLLGIAVTNLEDLGCPSIKDLKGVSYSCVPHTLLNEENNFKCALADATRLRNWMFYHEHPADSTSSQNDSCFLSGLRREQASAPSSSSLCDYR